MGYISFILANLCLLILYIFKNFGLCSVNSEHWSYENLGSKFYQLFILRYIVDLYGMYTCIYKIYIFTYMYMSTLENINEIKESNLQAIHLKNTRYI